MSAPKTLEDDQLYKLLEFIKSDHNTSKQYKNAIRNWAIAVIMSEAGLRVNEVRQLAISHLWFADAPVRNLVVRREIAKNNKERQVPVSDILTAAILQLKECYWPNPLEFVHLPAFYGRNVTEFLSVRHIERIIANAGTKALGMFVHPHMLRHTFASRLMRVTNARTVQELLGHSSLQSTQIYTHPNGNDLREAINNMPSVSMSVGSDS